MAAEAPCSGPFSAMDEVDAGYSEKLRLTPIISTS
jgi:hypothetical protein